MMRKFLLGSALAAALTFGAHGTSFASTVSPVAPELRLNVTGSVVVANENELSNQSRDGQDDNDTNGNNGSE